MTHRLLVLLVTLGLAACTSLPWNVAAPKVSLADVGINSLGLLEQHLDVGLRIRNPNDFDLTIEALEFELDVNGRPFANGQSRKPALIPAAASAMLRVDTYLQSKNLILQLKTLSPGRLKAGVPYRVKGRIKTDKSSSWLPFDHSGVYGSDEKRASAQAGWLLL